MCSTALHHPDTCPQLQPSSRVLIKPQCTLQGIRRPESPKKAVVALSALACTNNQAGDAACWNEDEIGVDAQVVEPAMGYVSAPNSPHSHAFALSPQSKDDLSLIGSTTAYHCMSCLWLCYWLHVMFVAVSLSACHVCGGATGCMSCLWLPCATRISRAWYHILWSHLCLLNSDHSISSHCGRLLQSI